MFSRGMVGSLIKRYPLPAVKRSITTDTVGGWDNQIQTYVFDNYVLEECLIQTPKMETVATLPSGIDVERTYVLRTNTPIYSYLQGTDKLSCAIYVPDSIIGIEGVGGWYVVQPVRPKVSDVIKHYQLYITKDDDIVSDTNKNEYPDISTILPSLQTKVDVVSGLWIPTWVGG